MTQPVTAVWPGRPYPLGATWDGEGVNFALFSEHADKVELCLFDASGRRELQRIPLREQTDQIWHAYLPEVRPGQLYSYRVYGPYAPAQGHRFNPNKLLLDPYAKSIVGLFKWSNAHFGYEIGHPHEDLTISRRDSAPEMPKCQVIDLSFNWGDDRRPNTPWHQTIIYETHVKGFTIDHPEVPSPLRGTYAGMATSPVIDYLQRLEITAIELMPVHAFVDDRHLVEKGRCNYWGYNSIGFFAPDQRYLASGHINEFKTMVKTLHSAGIEVILDVVYNHTAEGNQRGPTLCFRGIDNAAYYRLVPNNLRYYMDYTGCGNTLNMMHPRALQLIMDSLRYWVVEMHVDGFRFDLAAALARELHAVDQLGAFMDIIHQDPVLSQVKLIAEPWDIGEGGYQVGNFPVGWTEWNGKYRDVVRDYWRGKGGLIGQLAYRLTGSSDLYQHSGRRPYASINFITAHDGFTLYDLVSYNEKHNEANGEANRDGEPHNRSWHCGTEGDTQDADILALRARQRRNFLATLLLSQGVPMLLAGDEIGRTQRGNNNAYCQDNEISWVNWELSWLSDNRDLFEFTSRLIRLRKAHPIFRRRRFFQGQRIRGIGVRDLIWLNPDGTEISDAQWHHAFAHCLGMYLVGEALEEQDERGHRIKDADFLLLLNAHDKAIPFTIPWNGASQALVDTAMPPTAIPPGYHPAGQPYPLQGRALVLLTPHHHAGAERPVFADQPMTRRRYFMPFGAQLLEDGKIRFRLWAPAVGRAEVCLEEQGGGEANLSMTARAGGWFELTTDRARVADRYRFRIDNHRKLPDPASRYNPEGVHGPSQIIDPGQFLWQDTDWRGRPWEEAIIYQLHVGTFTPQGTLAGIQERLDYLVELGVTAIELMPIAAFPGTRSWGYHGVLPFAPAANYGHPNDLKNLVQTAHQKGLMVFLNVAYHQLGVDGNPLLTYAPQCFKEHPTNPWAVAPLHLTGPDRRTVRDFFLHNALYWLEEFHLDGLHLHAGHALSEEAKPDILEELALAVRQGPGEFRHCHLMLDHDLNATRYLGWYDQGGPRLYDAQWNNDIQHTLQVLLTGETAGPLADYAEKPVWYLGRCLSEGFAYQGEPSPARNHKPRGEPSRHLPATAFINFLQNHAQVGDQAFGERIHQLADPGSLQTLIATLLLAPAPPLLFMGEEFAAANPFLYFCDFDPKLTPTIAVARRQSFAHLLRFKTPMSRARIPSPNDPATFQRSTLDWKTLHQPPHSDWFGFYRHLLAVRQREIVPRLRGMTYEETGYEVLGERGLRVSWSLGDGSILNLLGNFGNEPLGRPQLPKGTLLYSHPWEAEGALAQQRLPPWSVVWFLKAS